MQVSFMILKNYNYRENRSTYKLPIPPPLYAHTFTTVLCNTLIFWNVSIQISAFLF